MICLTHNQQYSRGEYCVYCGNPIKAIVSTQPTGGSPREGSNYTTVPVGSRKPVMAMYCPEHETFYAISGDPFSNSICGSCGKRKETHLYIPYYRY